MTVYELTHLFFRSGGEPVYSPKGLGLFASTESAEEAVRYYKTQPGFRDAPDAFSVREGRCTGKFPAAWFLRRWCIFIRRTTNLKFPPNLGLFGAGERRRKRRCAVLYGEHRAGPCPRDYRGGDREPLPCRPSELGRGLYRFRLTAGSPQRTCEDGRRRVIWRWQIMIRRTGLWRYAGLFPERKLRSAVWRRGRCWNITANTPAPEEEPWIPLLVEKYRPEAILGFSETGHTYVSATAKRSSGMGGVRKTGEDECLIYGLFLTPETHRKGIRHHAFSRAGSRRALYAVQPRLGSFPPRRRLAFMKRWATPIWTATASAGRTTGSSIWRSI